MLKINNEWRKKMQLKVDYNNMMADFIGAEQGFTDKDFSKNKALIANAYKEVCKKIWRTEQKALPTQTAL